MSLAAFHRPSFHKVPRRHASVLFALLMSLAVSGILSAGITAVNTGLDAGFAARWLRAYALAWSFAFPTVIVMAPRVRTLVERLTE